MRELTASTVLALHALHLMLRKHKPLMLREIRNSSGFSSDQIRSVLGRLRRSGLIRFRSGRGYILAKAPGEISVRDLVLAVDRPKPPMAPCGGDYESCATRGCCILAPLCRAEDERHQEMLRSFTLAELMDVPPGLPNCLDPKVKSEAS